MNWGVALRLGRVSNLPTVWTNTLTGIALAGGSVADPRTLPLIVALSLFYVAGMYLNDAFDAEIDARERPDRPIPSRAVSARTVFGVGFAMMALGFGALLWIGYGLPGDTSFHPALGGLALGTAIVGYDWHHKENALSPVLMGICRMLVYITAGLAVTASLPGPLLAAALVLLCYLIGLTYIAKQETLGEVKNLWPALFLAVPVVYGAATALDYLTGVVVFVAFVAWLVMALGYLKRRAPGDVPRAVTSLLAGICLLDAVLIAGAGATAIAWLAVLAFVLALVLQRFVPAT
jgi:hypothetical protein